MSVLKFIAYSQVTIQINVILYSLLPLGDFTSQKTLPNLERIFHPFLTDNHGLICGSGSSHTSYNHV